MTQADSYCSATDPTDFMDNDDDDEGMDNQVWSGNRHRKLTCTRAACSQVSLLTILTQVAARSAYPRMDPTCRLLSITPNILYPQIHLKNMGRSPMGVFKRHLRMARVHLIRPSRRVLELLERKRTR